MEEGDEKCFDNKYYTLVLLFFKFAPRYLLFVVIAWTETCSFSPPSFDHGIIEPTEIDFRREQEAFCRKQNQRLCQTFRA